MSVPLELTGLTKVFPTPTGPFVAVKDVNALIETGEFVAILGHSGCGKSTVLSILAGLDRPRTAASSSTARRLSPGAGARDRVSVAVPAAVAHGSTERRARRVTRHGQAKPARDRGDSESLSRSGRRGDAADQLPPQLSLGTQQCVSLARALSVEPRFLLLDEPFSQLDSLTRFELQDILLRVWESSGKTVVMVTHDVDEALYLADRLI